MKQNKNIAYGYITYSFNDKLKNIFFKEIDAKEYEIYSNGIHITNQNVTSRLMKILSLSGFVFNPTNKKHLVGRNKIFGIKYSVVKYINNGKIKEFQVIIPGVSTSDLERKITIIIDEIKSITGVVGKIDGSKKWEECNYAN